MDFVHGLQKQCWSMRNCYWSGWRYWSGHSLGDEGTANDAGARVAGLWMGWMLVLEWVTLRTGIGADALEAGIIMDEVEQVLEWIRWVRVWE